VVNKTSHAVAEHFEGKERGYIREGYWAELTLVDNHATTTVNKRNVLFKVALRGHEFPAAIAATWANAELAYANGRVTPRFG